MGRHLAALAAIALLLAGASSAGAAVLTPPQGDFGRLLIGKTSAPIVFTVTTGGESESELRQNDGGGGFVTGYNCLCFLERQAGPRDCLTVSVLTSSIPSCTITVLFKPDHPGISKGVVFTNYLGSGAIAKVTGVGLLSRKTLWCRKKNGKFINRKPITKWCVNWHPSRSARAASG